MYYIGSKNPRSILVIAGMIMFLAMAAKGWMATQPKVVSEDYTTATVLSVDKNSSQYKTKAGVENTLTIAIGELELENGKKVKTSLLKPYPGAGDKVSIKLTEYSDGSMTAAPVR